MVSSNFTLVFRQNMLISGRKLHCHASKTAKVKTAKVKTAKVKTAKVKTAKVKTAKVKTAEVKIANKSRNHALLLINLTF